MATVRPEHPLHEVGSGDAPSTLPQVREPNVHELHGLAGIAEHAHPLLEPMAVVSVHRVPRAVSYLIRGTRPGGSRARRPDLRGLLIPQVEDLCRVVCHGIAAPGRETVLSAVLVPRVPQSAFSTDAPELGLSDHRENPPKPLSNSRSSGRARGGVVSG